MSPAPALIRRWWSSCTICSSNSTRRTEAASSSSSTTWTSSCGSVRASSAWSKAKCSPKASRSKCNRPAQCSSPTLAIEFRKVIAGYSPTLTILNQLSFVARDGEITLLIGPNGAGKSTALKTLFGLLTPRSGDIRLDDKSVAGTPPREMLAHGVAFVPQGRNLFGSLSVLHNLELGGITLKSGLASRMDEVLARFPRLRERLQNQASTLSGGEQKQLEIGRALLLRPRVLLIDEPSIGLSPLISQEVFRLLRTLADGGTTVIMVEQNVKSALNFADRALVLEMGRLALERPAAQLLHEPDLHRLFLGGSVQSRAS